MVKHFLGDTTVHFSRRVSSIESRGDQWIVTDTNKGQETFDILVLTCPSGQVLELGGNIRSHLQAQGELFRKLEAVKYSSRWAVGLYYDPSAWSAFDDVAWSGRYVTKEEDDALVWIACESQKRCGKASADGPGPVVLAHAGVPWSLQNDRPAAMILKDLLPRVHKFIPGLVDFPTVETKVLRWKFSQVAPGTHVGGTEIAAVPVDGAPKLILAGDSIAGSNFENCIRSGMQAASSVKTMLGLSGASL